MHDAMRMLLEEVQRQELNGAYVFLPGGEHNVVTQVRRYLMGKWSVGGMPRVFGPYVEALEAVWPSLFKANKRAGLIMACEIFLEVAELEGFQVSVESITVSIGSGRGSGSLYNGDPGRIHGDASWDDGATTGCVA